MKKLLIPSKYLSKLQLTYPHIKQDSLINLYMIVLIIIIIVIISLKSLLCCIYYNKYNKFIYVVYIIYYYYYFSNKTLILLALNINSALSISLSILTLK